MIPLRVSLENFLCHARQEFRFDEHPVWLLHGPNGVGKSAVFDASHCFAQRRSCRSMKPAGRPNSANPTAPGSTV